MAGARMGWIGLGLVLVFPLAQAQQPATKAFGDVVVCESDDMRQHYCRADTRGGVVLARQLSRERCDQGRTWDFDDRGIWVSGGCRGEFMLGDPGHGRPRPSRPPVPGPGPGWGEDVVLCESIREQRQFCDVDTRDGVRLVQQLSDSSCIEGRTWGWNRRGIWVDRGCRAEFALGRGGFHPGGDGWQTLRCESENRGYQRCGVRRLREVHLVRQFSDTDCRQGRNWDWDRSGIWVNQGCRAEFSFR